MRKTLLAVALSVTALSAHADYQCSVTPRDDVILSPQQVQVKGENGDLVIKPDGNLTFNGKAYALSAAQRINGHARCELEERGLVVSISSGVERLWDSTAFALEVGA